MQAGLDWTSSGPRVMNVGKKSNYPIICFIPESWRAGPADCDHPQQNSLLPVIDSRAICIISCRPPGPPPLLSARYTMENTRVTPRIMYS